MASDFVLQSSSFTKLIYRVKIIQAYFGFKPAPFRFQFCRIAIAGLLALSPLFAISEELGPIALPAPRSAEGKPLMEALKQRRTIRQFTAEKIPVQLLGDLLWAAFGINRSEEGRRTAPSAMNSQEVDLYVALDQGLYLYEAKPHRLQPVMAEDLRPKTSGQSFSNAPVVLILVADLSRLDKAKPETRPFYADFDAGCICQNVYLYCASAGLATVVHDLNREPLATAMKLRPEQKIIFAQAIGWPTEAQEGRQGSR